MLISESELAARLNSPLNLLNRQGSKESRNRAMSLFGIGENSGNSGRVEEIKQTENSKEDSKQDLSNAPAPKLNPTFVNPFSSKEDDSDKVDSAESLALALKRATSRKNPEESKDSKELSSNSGDLDHTQQSPTIDDLLDNSDGKIKLATVYNGALALMKDTIQELQVRVPELKADKLPAILAAASKVVTDIRRERIEANKSKGDREVHYHFYTPERKKLSDYEVIDVEASVNPAA